MWGKSQIHFLHKINESPRKMHPLQMTTPANYKGLTKQFTTDPQTKNANNQHHQLLTILNTTINIQPLETRQDHVRMQM